VASAAAMKRSYVSNILLLSVLLLLWVLFERAQQAQLIPQIETTISAEQVHHIKIQRQGQADIELERQSADWLVSQPFKAAASASRVNLLLSLLESPFSRRITVKDAEQLEAVDLAAPRLSVYFNDQAFHFGGIESISGHRYLQHQDHLYLFEDDLSPLLLASANSFINNRLFNADEQIVQLTLPILLDDALQADQAISLKYQDGKWQSAEQQVDEAANAVIAQSWQNAYAMQVVTEKANQLENALPIEIVFSDGTTHALLGQLSKQGLAIVHPEKQLRYQFPAALAPAFFPATTESP